MKNLRSQLSYLKLIISNTNTSFYAKLAWKKKLIKTNAVFNTPDESKVKLTTACVAIWLHRKWRQPSMITAFTSFRLNWRYHGKRSKYYVLCCIFNFQNNNKSFSPLCMYDLNTQARRVLFSVSKMLSDFRHNIVLKKNKLVNYRYIPSFCNLLSGPL